MNFMFRMFLILLAISTVYYLHYFIHKTKITFFINIFMHHVLSIVQDLKLFFHLRVLNTPLPQEDLLSHKILQF